MREKLKRGGQVNSKIEEGEREISERYKGQTVSFEGVSKLLARVGGRVI